MTDQKEIPFGDGDLFTADPQPEADKIIHDTVSPAEGASLPEAGEAVMGDGPIKRMFDGNFLKYASYVIRDRAIPELDDGLKPVQRRILFALHENDDGKFIKVANIVGYCMQFHPHGDASIGDALVSLTNRQFLIEGQGNFGNVLTGDPAAAFRYIECRLTELARSEIFNDELTDLVASYDGRKEEPVCLPVKIPLLLMLGADGIAVGISTRILPHNFSELIEAQIAILNKKPFAVFPDFQQGGVMDASQYDSGRGQVQVRAIIEKKDASTLVINELPYGTTTDSVIASIEDASRRGKVKVRSISDFTAEKVEIELTLQPDENPDRAIEALYAFSQCQVQLSSHIVVIRSNKPVEMTVDEILKHNTERLLHLLKRELLLEQKHLNDDLQRKMLVHLFVEHRIYKEIEGCRTSEAVEAAVLDGLAPFRSRLVRDITAKDLEMLLEMPIRRISQFDLEKNKRDMEQVRGNLAEVAAKLDSVPQHVIRYLRNLVKKFGGAYPRRTKINKFAAVEVREITATELTIGYQKDKGYLGHGIKGDVLLQCSSYDKLILFWSDGRYKVMPPPEKVFVGDDIVYAAVADRDRVFTIVYTEDMFTYAKRFAVGGTIMNKEYRCAPKGAGIVMLVDDRPAVIYLKYAASAAQKINQQEFAADKLPVRDPKSRGAMMTSKKVIAATGSKPAEWDDSLDGRKGVFMDFGAP